MFTRQQRNGTGDGQKVLKLNYQRGNRYLNLDRRKVTIQTKVLRNQSNHRADVEKVEAVKGEMKATVAVRGKVTMKRKVVMISERKS